ncbi:MAG: hypothetical protein KAU21_06030, partial [Gammaproteobacteria bacterium]|nr:hypothetical protein [Gammaproteobacteria bacterium]
MFFKALAKINLFKPHIIPLVALVFAGFILLVLLILYFFSQQHSNLESVINQGEIESRKMRINSELMELARSRTRLLSQLTDLDDLFEQDEKNILLENAAGRYASLRNQLLELDISAEEQVIIDKQSEVIPLILPAFRKVVELAMRGNPSDGIRAKNLMYDVVLPRQGELIDLLGELIKLEQKTIQQLSENSRLSVQEMQYR